MANDVQKYNETGFERMLDSFFDGWTFKGGKIPPVDIEETNNEYVIKASLPGVDEKELDVHVDDHVLHIAGKNYSKSEDTTERHYILKERYCSTFDRAFTLPEEADEENISAAFEKGVLTLTVPKKAKQEAKKISVTINR